VPDANHGPVTLDDLKGRNFVAVWEVAAILELDRRTIRSAARDGRIPSVKAGSSYRIPVAWLLSAASAQTAGRPA
jgi:excisionase family DNA binding protein